MLSFQKSFSQSPQPQPGRMLAVNIGTSKAGTGDMRGLVLGVEYEKRFRPKLSWSSELGMTIHDGEDLLIVTTDDGGQQDLSYRYTTAGAQLSGKLGWHFAKSEHIDVGLKLGGLVRYQSSSVASERAVLFPLATGYPLPLTINRNFDPQRTVSVGGVFQLFARYTFNKTWSLGALTGLQVDTNGDAFFPSLSLNIGRRF
ncbi:hypothetical protein FEN17_00935 [Dyadobacter luticola]|uniref:Uncharacterized protein n=2 Tax=Dyadobacter luticola TaxID=1979387 RepID=A0A5R9L1H9_9BACT|nr:hypothetical protein FEN17_00935 [Dyadobacter luticola]